MKADFQIGAALTPDAARRFADTAMGAKLLGVLGRGSPAQRKLADWLLRNPISAASRGVEDLASAAGVSAPTISRFAREIGYEGLSAFRADLADAIGASFDPVSKLREGFDQGRGGGAAADSIATARAHAAALAEGQTAERVRALCGAIKAAGTVYVMGFGLSSHLAAMLALGLQPFRDRVVTVVQFGGTEVAAGRIATIGPEDLLIAITLPRYGADAIQLARFARAQGARVCVVTDSVAAPIARLADDLLTAPALHPVLSSSSVGALALIEAVVSDFIMSDSAHLTRAERLRKALAVYVVDEL